MSEFILLFRGGDEARTADQQSPESWQAHMQQWKLWIDGLTEQGKFVGSQPLKIAGKVVNGRKKLVTNGPFVEGKEIVGGYLICKAANIDEAIEIAKGCPMLDHDGLVEVREINAVKL